MSDSEYWFYANSEGHVKILSRDELESAVFEGTIDARGFLWKPGQGEWKPVGEITIDSFRAVNDLKQNRRQIAARGTGKRWLVIVTSAAILSGLIYLGLTERRQSEYASDIDGKINQQADEDALRIAPTNDSVPNERSPHEFLEEASRAIINIMARTKEGWNQGTGFVVDPQGVAVTNYHIIENADQIRVQFDNEEVLEETAIIAVDPEHDLALLRAGRSNLATLRLGDSEDLQVGTEIYAIGNPLGLRRSITSGLLSARRSIEGMDLLQLSAPISPGSSGSPILDRNGDVVGIVVGRVEAGQNLNFAIPVEYLHDMLMNPLAFSTTSQQERGSKELESYVRLGHLDIDSSTLETGELYEGYEIELRESQRVRVSVRSDDFDPYLVVVKPSREVLQNDDMGGTDLSAGLDITVDESGEWSIIVTSYEEGEVGSFELRVKFLVPSRP